jgi:hypothetical protein
MNSDSFLLCLGYTCMCGERVFVFKLPVNSGKQIAISPKTVSCRNGHSRTVTVDQLGTLDHWIDAAGEKLSVAV